MNKILIIVDTTDKQQTALTRGIELAQTMGMSVEAVAFTHEYLKAAGQRGEMSQEARLYEQKSKTS